MKDKLGGKFMRKFVGLRAKTYSYLIDDGSQNEKALGTKKCAIKENLNLKIIKTVQKQPNLKIKVIQKNIKVTQIVLKKDNKHIIDNNHKQFIRNNKSILKTQEKFNSEIHNVFTKEINEIALSSKDDKRLQSIDLIGTFAYGRSKDLVSEKEVIKCNNIIKQQKND